MAAAAAAPGAAAAPADALPAPVVVLADMPADARQKCIDFAIEALTTKKVEMEQAAHIKNSLQAWNGALWHVIVGTTFGASVAHEVHAVFLFRIGKVHVLAFQSFEESSLVSGKKEAHVPRAVGGKKKEDEEEEAKAE